MTLQGIAQAVRDTAAVFRRRPDLGPGDDTPAVVSWAGGLRFEGTHPTGRRIATDMPDRIGGEGGETTPGWLARAGLGSCTATCIVIAAAEAGVELTALSVETASRSDSRGVLGMEEADGTRVDACARDYRLVVTIGAKGATRESLEAIVAESLRRSPIYLAFAAGSPVGVEVRVLEA